VIVLRDIGRSPESARNTASAFVAISKSGDLAYVPAETDTPIHVSVDLDGHVTSLPDSDVQGVRISPDGTRMIALRGDAWWMYSLTHRAAPRRVITANGVNINPLWSPDGTRITFQSRRESGSAIISLPATGDGVEQLLLPLDGTPVGWSRDGNVLFYLFQQQLWSWARGTQPQPRGTLDAPYASLSPDGKWIAFHTFEEGGAVVYIQSVSKASERFRMGEEGGHAPLWSPDGRKLFYMSPADSLMAVDVHTTPSVAFGNPVVLVPRTVHGLAVPERRYDVTPDGRQLLLQVPDVTDSRSREVHIVLNWTEELKRRAPSQSASLAERLRLFRAAQNANNEPR
jgi:dipeptidyl aminopeptidase/acylaminoacyl peptidase